MNDIRDRVHRQLIEVIVRGLANRPLVLKGGTSLMLAYGMDRYSEDIDYDSNTRIVLAKDVDTIMRDKTRMEYAIKIKKDTDTTSRIFVHYSTEKVEEATLKIEVKNNRVLQTEEIRNDPGFYVYSINHICQNKIDATQNRIKPRDLYDLGYVSKHFKTRLNAKNLDNLKIISEDKTLHRLYKAQWSKDKYVREKPFDTTIAALKSVKKFLHNKENERDLEI